VLDVEACHSLVHGKYFAPSTPFLPLKFIMACRQPEPRVNRATTRARWARSVQTRQQECPSSTPWDRRAPLRATIFSAGDASRV
jgi:hypothetical protein